MDSGFAGGEDETYNVYDQPFRSGKDMAQNIYRPSKGIDKDAYTDDLDTLMNNNRYYQILQWGEGGFFVYATVIPGALWDPSSFVFTKLPSHSLLTS